MDHISAIVLAPDVCVIRSIWTDATGIVLHYRLCMTHMTIELCDIETCELCRRLRSIHGDSEETTA